MSGRWTGSRFMRRWSEREPPSTLSCHRRRLPVFASARTAPGGPTSSCCSTLTFTGGSSRSNSRTRRAPLKSRRPGGCPTPGPALGSARGRNLCRSSTATARPPATGRRRSGPIAQAAQACSGIMPTRVNQDPRPRRHTTGCTRQPPAATCGSRQLRMGCVVERHRFEFSSMSFVPAVGVVNVAWLHPGSPARPRAVPGPSATSPSSNR